MTVLLPLSSAITFAAVIVLAVTVRRTLARLCGVEAHRQMAVEAAQAHHDIVEALMPVLTAARAWVSPCPRCDLASDEPCLCETRRRAMTDAVAAAEASIVRFTSPPD